MDEYGVWGPIRKQTLLRTTSVNLFRAMNLECLCRGPHVHLKDMQNYEPGFVNKASKAIQRDLEEAWARRQAAAIMVMDDAEVVPDGQHAVEALNLQHFAAEFARTNSFLKSVSARVSKLLVELGNGQDVGVSHLSDP